MTEEPRPRLLGAVLFPDFELLDLFGPLEMFGNLKQWLTVTTVAEHAGPVRSAQAASALADVSFDGAPQFDLLLIPGGWGTRAESANAAMLDFVRRQVAAAEIVMTVCTGTMILAATGLIDGVRATTNKALFKQVREGRPAVDWVEEARWVDSGKFVTASGVSAGIDMALSVIARLWGAEVAGRMATLTEYDWHRDPSWDPFAKVHGLVAAR